MDRGRGGTVLLTAIAAFAIVATLAPRADASPVPIASWSPQEPLAGDPVAFDGSASYDDGSWGGGSIVDWRWDFGDGSEASGVQVDHVYENPGTYQLHLNVTNDVSREDGRYYQITIYPRPPPTPFVSYEHPSGFRLPVPANWDLRENEEFEGTVFELTVYERSVGSLGILTNILVETDRDSTVRETSSYLDEQIDFALEQVRQESPNVRVREGPIDRQVANHSAVSVTIEYEGEQLVQRLVLVVSDPHDRFWVLILTTSEPEFPGYAVMFEAMVSGFEITAAPPSFTAALTVAGVGGFVAVLAVVAIVATKASRARRARFASYQATLKASRVCATCGAPALGAADRFCMRCGRPFPSRYCAACGTPATSMGDRFCMQCGSPFQISPAPLSASPAPDSSPPRSPSGVDLGTERQGPP